MTRLKQAFALVLFGSMLIFAVVKAQGCQKDQPAGASEPASQPAPQAAPSDPAADAAPAPLTEKPTPVMDHMGASKAGQFLEVDKPGEPAKEQKTAPNQQKR
jgi:hypothetical protein